VSATANATVTLIRPTAGTGRDPERDERDEIQVRAWLKQISGERARNTLGQLTFEAYKCRFAAPAKLVNQITAGWRVRDEAGNEYQVKGVTQTGRMYNLTLERA